MIDFQEGNSRSKPEPHWRDVLKAAGAGIPVSQSQRSKNSGSETKDSLRHCGIDVRYARNQLAYSLTDSVLFDQQFVSVPFKLAAEIIHRLGLVEAQLARLQQEFG